MKALLLVRNLPPRGRSAGRLALEYGKLLRENRADVTLLTADAHSGRPERVREGLTVKNLPELPFFAPEDHLQATLDAVRLAKSLAIEVEVLREGDIVLGFDWCTSLVASCVSKSTGARMHHVYNGAVEARLGPGGPAGAWISEMERWALESAHTQVFPSESAKAEAERRFGKLATAATVIPTAISGWQHESEESCAEFRQSLASLKEPVLLFVGGATRANGFDLFLDALPAVIYRKPTVKVVMIGPGPDEPDLHERLPRLLKTGRVQVLGEVGDSVYRALLQVSDVLVSPSRYDPNGLKLWEAAEFAVPTVALSTDCVRDAVREGCPIRVMEHADASLLSERVLEALNSRPKPSARKAVEQARQTRGHTARERSAALFDRKQSVDER
jgi:glycosyltransferase involved in cell wall biosynthesis